MRSFSSGDTSRPEQHSFRVLVADDDEASRQLYSELLTDWGYDVVVSSDGHEALAALRASPGPRLAVLDWHMPGLDGLQVCQQAKEDPDIPLLYTIVLTGETTVGDAARALEAGADDFVSKPVDIEEFRSRVGVGVRIIDYEQALVAQSEQVEAYAHEVTLLAREREIYLQSFLHSVQSVCITDAEGRILHVNQAFEKQYGYRETEARGKTLGLFDPSDGAYVDLGISPEERDRTRQEQQSRILAPTVGHWEGTIPQARRDGTLMWVEQSISAIHGTDGRMIGQVAMPVDVTERREREFEIRLEIYRAITSLAEARDTETGEHLKRMAQYATILAACLGQPRRFVEDIHTFAPLHDIGKVGIPDSILLAPRKLTPDETEIMQTHTTLGYHILEGRPTLEMAADIAYSHHEKWDGNGYPLGLAGEKAPLSARIVAVGDVYDALRSRRPYKDPWPRERVVDLILSESGKHFDPAVVEVFDASVDQFEATLEAHGDDGGALA